MYIFFSYKNSVKDFYFVKHDYVKIWSRHSCARDMSVIIIMTFNQSHMLQCSKWLYTFPISGGLIMEI